MELKKSRVLEKRVEDCKHTLIQDAGTMQGKDKDLQLYTCLYCRTTMVEGGLIKIKDYEEYVKAGGVQLYFKYK